MIAEDVVVLSIEKQKWEHVANNDVECVVDSTAPHHIIPTKGLFTMYKVGDFGTLVALGEMPRSHYTFKIFLRVTSFLGHIWIFFLSRDDWFATVQSVKCSQTKVVFESSLPYSIVGGFEVSLVSKQDLEDFNQTNAQWGSRSIITFEGWDGANHEFDNSEIICCDQ